MEGMEGRACMERKEGKEGRGGGDCILYMARDHYATANASSHSVRLTPSAAVPAARRNSGSRPRLSPRLGGTAAPGAAVPAASHASEDADARLLEEPRFLASAANRRAAPSCSTAETYLPKQSQW
jgi:hypothetical protein